MPTFTRKIAISGLTRKLAMSNRVAATGKVAGAAGLALVAVSTVTPSGASAQYQVMDTAAVVNDDTGVSGVGSLLLVPAPVPAMQAIPRYPNNLDGWIREAMDVLRAHNIPASYEGIRRNIMRESTGNPRAINLYDSNAAAGIPSKGLLQVIDPTFKRFHVEGTSWDIYDPVANITAACNYAAHTYGSMDNVNSAY